MADQLTPLYQVLAYEAPSFDSRLELIRGERERLKQNKAILEKKKLTEWELDKKYEYDTKLYNYRSGLEKEQAVAVAGEKGKYDVEQEKIKAQADVAKDRRQFTMNRAKEDQVNFSYLFRDGILPQPAVISYDFDTDSYGIYVGETLLATDTQSSTVLGDLQKRKNYLEQIDANIDKENVSNVEQLSMWRTELLDLKNTTILETLKKGVVPTFKEKSTGSKAGEAADLKTEQQLSVLASGLSALATDSGLLTPFEMDGEGTIDKYSVGALVNKKDEYLRGKDTRKLTDAGVNKAIDAIDKLNSLFANWQRITGITTEKDEKGVDRGLNANDYMFNPNRKNDSEMFVRIGKTISDKEKKPQQAAGTFNSMSGL